MAKKVKRLGPKWIYSRGKIEDKQGRAARNLEFLDLLRHQSGNPLLQDPWHRRVLEQIYGPSNENGERRTRVVYLQVGRGARKTTLGACLALLHTFGPERTGKACISAAADRKQARYAFEEAQNIIAATEALADPAVSHVQDFKNRITHRKSKTVYEAISADAPTQWGRTIGFALVDELHAFKKLDLWHTIRTGLNKVPGSLLVITTTAGRGEQSADYPIYQYAKRVEAGEIDDPGFLPIIFETPKDWAWDHEETWIAANPGLWPESSGYPDIGGLRQLAREAKERPADREVFKQVHLGIRSEYSAAPFVDMDIFNKGRVSRIDLEKYRGVDAVLSLDFARTTDLCGLMAVLRDGEDIICKSWAFVPGDDLDGKAERDGLPYREWQREEWITVCDGPVISESEVEEKIRELCEDLTVLEIVCDKTYLDKMMQRLTDDGLPVASIPQGWKTQSPALNVLEKAILRLKLKWDNPAFKSAIEASKVRIIDDAGNRKISKTLSTSRVDLAYCAWMGVSRMAALDTPSALSSESFDPNNYVINLCG